MIARRRKRETAGADARRRAERGSVLVLTLLVCMILLGLGLTAMWLSSEGGKVSTNVSRRGEAYFAAQSALERARGLLLAAADWNGPLSGCPTSSDWKPADHIDTAKGRVLCAASAPLYKVKIYEAGAVSAGQVGTLNTIEYTLWIRNDDEEGGAMSLADNNTRVIVRAEGVARGDQGFVALEQIIGRGGGAALKEAAYSQSGMGPTGANSGKAALSN